VTDPYSGREQTKVKHFILKHYLQELAFKVLRFSDLAYVDGFSGPWKSQREDFSDSSFRIAIDVLLDAQRVVHAQTGRLPKVRCFFSENDSKAFAQLTSATAPFNKPAEGFEIRTFNGAFEDALPDIESFTKGYFNLVFIDPTGWTGYSLEKIKRLFSRQKSEVLINFMYDFVNRAASMSDPKTTASLDPILGGPDWENRLDPGLPRGQAVEKLFRNTLRSSCQFD
jgi:three-Cys-motif partner protein